MKLYRSNTHGMDVLLGQNDEPLDALLQRLHDAAPFTLGFKSNTEVRIMKILKKENTNRFMLFLSVLLVVLLVTACTTTQAVGPASGTEETEQMESSASLPEEEGTNTEITDTAEETEDPLAEAASAVDSESAETPEEVLSKSEFAEILDEDVEVEYVQEVTDQYIGEIGEEVSGFFAESEVDLYADTPEIRVYAPESETE